MEQWLLANANAVNIDPLSFNLPYNMKGFKQITKTQDIDLNPHFYQFIKHLTNKNSPGIVTLRNWIEAFKQGTIEDIPIP
jgi:hypothetical protein